MNWFQFLRLIKTIYWDKEPDLDYIQSQGLLAVKIGQIHALRIDFLDAEKCKKLTQLYRGVVSIPSEQFMGLFQEYSSEYVKKRFSEVSEKTLASASIGQVHQALLENGDSVVIKLVKKDFRKNFTRDVNSVRNFFKWMIRFYPKLKKVGDPIGILGDIESYTLSELDLTNEIKGQEVLRKIHEKHSQNFDLSRNAFIKIYDELSNTNLLVSQFIDGPTFDELLDDGKLDYPNLLEFFKIFGYHVFVVGTFHGDIHPGNILFKDNKFYLVDCGSIGYVGEKIRMGLYNFFDRLCRYDYENAAYYLNKMSEEEIEGEAYENFKIKFLELYSDFTGKPVGEISLTQKMMHTIKLGVHSGMRFEKGIFSVIRALMYMDGMVLRCNPQAVLLEDMLKFIDEFKEGRDK